MKVRILLARVLVLSTYFLKNYFNTAPFVFSANKIMMQFCFISIISPLFIKNATTRIGSFNKISLKHSYLLLTWIYYLSFTEKMLFNKTLLKFFIAPVKKYIFTNVKAPIAHKTWSKEQYQKKYYRLKIAFQGHFLDSTAPSRLNAALWVLLFTKKNFPNFGTNLLFLQSLLFTYRFCEKTYFNLYQFQRN